jgi:hypothetical protein
VTAGPKLRQMLLIIFFSFLNLINMYFNEPAYFQFNDQTKMFFFRLFKAHIHPSINPKIIIFKKSVKISYHLMSCWWLISCFSWSSWKTLLYKHLDQSITFVHLYSGQFQTPRKLIKQAK